MVYFIQEVKQYFFFLGFTYSLNFPCALQKDCKSCLEVISGNLQFSVAFYISVYL